MFKFNIVKYNNITSVTMFLSKCILTSSPTQPPSPRNIFIYTHLDSLTMNYTNDLGSGSYNFILCEARSRILSDDGGGREKYQNRNNLYLYLRQNDFFFLTNIILKYLESFNFKNNAILIGL